MVLYVLLRLAYSTYYGAFGLKPEDVGLAQADMLIQSAVGVGLAVAVTAVLMTWTWLSVRAVFWCLLLAVRYPAWRAYRNRPAWPGSSLSYRDVLVEYLRARTATTADVAALRVPRRTRNELDRIWEGLGPIIRLTWSWMFKVSSAGIRVALIYSAIIGALVIIAFFIASMQAAASDATAVQAGTARHVSVGPLQLAAWGADPVKVTELRPTAEKVIPSGCLMYLGQANGITVLYDVKGQRTIRVPSTAFVVFGDTSCGP